MSSRQPPLDPFNAENLVALCGRVVCSPDPYRSSTPFQGQFSAANELCLRQISKPLTSETQEPPVYVQVVAPKWRQTQAHLRIGCDPRDDIHIPTSEAPEDVVMGNSERAFSYPGPSTATTLGYRPKSGVHSARTDSTFGSSLFESNRRGSSRNSHFKGSLAVYLNCYNATAVLKSLADCPVSVMAVANNQVLENTVQILENGSCINLGQEGSEDDMEYAITLGNDMLRLRILQPEEACYYPEDPALEGDEQLGDLLSECGWQRFLGQVYLHATPNLKVDFPPTGDIRPFSVDFVEKLDLRSLEKSMAWKLGLSQPVKALLSHTLCSTTSRAEEVVTCASKFENQLAVLQRLGRNVSMDAQFTAYLLNAQQNNVMRPVAFDSRSLTTFFEWVDCRNLAQPEWLQEACFSALERMDMLLVLAGISSLLNEMHHLGFVHGHIEPSNIYYSRFHRIIKVMSLSNVSSVDGRLPYGGGIDCVHPYYLAKEEARTGKRTQEGDIYALGVTGYFMLDTMPLPERNAGQRHRKGLILPDSYAGAEKSEEENVSDMQEWLSKLRDSSQCSTHNDGGLRQLLGMMTHDSPKARPSAATVSEFAFGELNRWFPDRDRRLHSWEKGYAARCDPWRTPRDINDEWLRKNVQESRTEQCEPEANDFAWVDEIVAKSGRMN